MVNPSPYMIYLQARGSILVASSPEILCHVGADRTVTNRSPTPIPHYADTLTYSYGHMCHGERAISPHALQHALQLAVQACMRRRQLPYAVAFMSQGISADAAHPGMSPAQ